MPTYSTLQEQLLKKTQPKPTGAYPPPENVTGQVGALGQPAPQPKPPLAAATGLPAPKPPPYPTIEGGSGMLPPGVQPAVPPPPSTPSAPTAPPTPLPGAPPPVGAGGQPITAPAPPVPITMPGTPEPMPTVIPPGGYQFGGITPPPVPPTGTTQPNLQDLLAQMMGMTTGAAAPTELGLTQEQLANLFGGTGATTAFPGLMYGPDFFRGMTDYMTQLAAASPAQDVLGTMGDVFATGPASYGAVGTEMLGQLRGLPTVETAPYQQLLESGLTRLGEEEQRAIDEAMMRFNRLGLMPEGQAAGTVITPMNRLLERFGRARGDLMTQLALQQGQREDALRQAQLAGYQGLLGLQQAGQTQTAGGLGSLAQLLQQQQAQQLGGLSGVSQQAFGQMMQDINLQNMFAQQEQQRQNQLINLLFGQTQPTFPTIAGQPAPQQAGSPFWGAMGSMMPFLLMQMFQPSAGGGGQ